jgi:hypothetical protein
MILAFLHRKDTLLRTKIKQIASFLTKGSSNHTPILKIKKTQPQGHRLMVVCKKMISHLFILKEFRKSELIYRTRHHLANLWL